MEYRFFRHFPASTFTLLAVAHDLALRAFSCQAQNNDILMGLMRTLNRWTDNGKETVGAGSENRLFLFT